MSILASIKGNILNKDSKGNSKPLKRLNNFLRNRIGVGVSFVIAGIIVYVIVTIFTIYSLLVSL